MKCCKLFSYMLGVFMLFGIVNVFAAAESVSNTMTVEEFTSAVEDCGDIREVLDSVASIVVTEDELRSALSCDIGMLKKFVEIGELGILDKNLRVRSAVSDLVSRGSEAVLNYFASKAATAIDGLITRRLAGEELTGADNFWWVFTESVRLWKTEEMFKTLVVHAEKLEPLAAGGEIWARRIIRGLSLFGGGAIIEFWF